MSPAGRNRLASASDHPSMRMPATGLAVALLGAALSSPSSAREEGAVPAPPFPSTRSTGWIGPPATWEALKGRVVLLDVWTFG
jgi:hypothetical protein